MAIVGRRTGAVTNCPTRGGAPTGTRWVGAIGAPAVGDRGSGAAPTQVPVDGACGGGRTAEVGPPTRDGGRAGNVACVTLGDTTGPGTRRAGANRGAIREVDVRDAEGSAAAAVTGRRTGRDGGVTGAARRGAGRIGAPASNADG